MPHVTIEVPQKFLDMVARFNQGEPLNVIARKSHDRGALSLLLHGGLGSRKPCKRPGPIAREIFAIYESRGHADACEAAIEAACRGRMTLDQARRLIYKLNEKQKKEPATP